MKKISLLAFAAASVAASAIAAPGSMYVAVDGGYKMTFGDASIKVFDAKNNEEYKENTDTAIKEAAKTAGKKTNLRGFVVSPKLGYVISDEMRADVSFSYGLGGKVYNDGEEDKRVELKSWNAMANFYYDFVNSSDFTPFVGLGVGYGSATTKAKEAMADKAAESIGSDVTIKGFLKGAESTAKGVAFGGTIGASYKLTDSAHLQFSYSLQYLPAAKFPEISKDKQSTGGDTKTFKTAEATFQKLHHSLNGGLRFVF